MVVEHEYRVTTIRGTPIRRRAVSGAYDRLVAGAVRRFGRRVGVFA
jgi:hypothetical protein